MTKIVPPKSSSHVTALASKGALPLYFITCQDMNGRDCYYYLISTAQKMRAYEQAREGAFDLNDYGDIIARGYGTEPDAATRAMLKERYGIE